MNRPEKKNAMNPRLVVDIAQALEDLPKYGKLKAPRRPEWVDRSREIDCRPPPALGEHTEEVLREIDFDVDKI